MNKAEGSKFEGADNYRLGRELIGLFTIFCGLLLVLSLATFDSRDPWLNHVVSDVSHIYNRAGLFGSYFSGLLFDAFGLGAWVFPFCLCLVGVRRILGFASWVYWRWGGFFILGVCLSVAGAARDIRLATSIAVSPGAGDVASHGGGLFGHLLYSAAVGWLSITGATLLWIFLLLFSVQILFGFSWISFLVHGFRYMWRLCRTMTEDIIVQHGEVPQGEPLSLETYDTQQQRQSTSRKSSKKIAIPKDVSVDTPRKKNAAATEDEFPAWGRGNDDIVFTIQDTNVTSAKGNEDIKGKVQSAPSPLFTTNAGKKQPEDVVVEDFDDDIIHTNSPQPEHKEDPQPSVVIAEPVKTEVVTTPTPSLAKNVLQMLRPKQSAARKNKLSLPQIDLLEGGSVNVAKMSRPALEAKGKSVMTCLTDFGIQCELVGITPGPVVTMFEVRPAPGVRVSRIANLNDDLALALKAVAVRIQAPVPGTNTVGIEIPNEVRETVSFKELIASQLFQQSPSLLTLALGKDIAGHPAVADLATMPHLLVAGATGAGKSVGINSIIISILYKATPETVKLLLIDPKRVEMAIYTDLPHLVHPVVTEMGMAKNALDWAVTEMERRYNDIARAGVRNIIDYNAKLKECGDELPPGMEGLEFMPYLVIIIDELADLMLTAAKEVETSIVRLAQLARAAGIHLILATQRPSVDVVTGLIKANFPCRISFQVTSKHDSRTILDTVGAEHLLGKGDMLYKPGGGKFQRLHGAFVSDKNVLAVVDYWKKQQKPEYMIDFSEWGADEGSEGIVGGGSSDIGTDPMYAEAADFVRQQGKVSISLIQRRFRIGFNKAARFVEQMEQDGIISPADGTKPRTVIR